MNYNSRWTSPKIEAFSDGWESYHTAQLSRSGSELVKILRFESRLKSSMFTKLTNYVPELHRSSEIGLIVAQRQKGIIPSNLLQCRVQRFNRFRSVGNLDEER